MIETPTEKFYHVLMTMYPQLENRTQDRLNEINGRSPRKEYNE